jgi:hypothetical protein
MRAAVAIYPPPGARALQLAEVGRGPGATCESFGTTGRRSFAGCVVRRSYGESDGPPVRGIQSLDLVSKRKGPPTRLPSSLSTYHPPAWRWELPRYEWVNRRRVGTLPAAKSAQCRGSWPGPRRLPLSLPIRSIPRPFYGIRPLYARHAPLLQAGYVSPKVATVILLCDIVATETIFLEEGIRGAVIGPLLFPVRGNYVPFAEV